MAVYLARVAGCEKPAVVTNVQAGVSAVIVGSKDNLSLLEVAGLQPNDLRKDGFAHVLKEGRLYVIGADPRGVLYGCYDLIKRYAGVRWLVPGADGEYVPNRHEVSLPDGFKRRIEHPRFAWRTSIGRGKESHLWHLRNFMWTTASYSKSRGLNDDSSWLERHAVEGNPIFGNSHIFGCMMCGFAEGEERKARMAKLFEEHPEYFPEIRGQRTFSWRANGPNPCVSNAALLDLMASNLCVRLNRPHAFDRDIIILFNDSPIWCECEACKALDAPELANTRGAHSDRYWYVLTELEKRVRRQFPAARIGGTPYLDTWYPPARVKVPKDTSIKISFNNQCWRHSVDDPSCTVNEGWRKTYKLWREAGFTNLHNRDEIGAFDGSDTPGFAFLPVEKVLWKNFGAYQNLGCDGSAFCVREPGARPPATKSPYFGKPYHWLAMWQAMYLSAHFLWTSDGNPDEILEEANQLYYGKGWDGGMREFRRLLTELFVNTPGCIGWGQGAPLGRCLDRLGSEERLLALLDAAESAAKSDPDPRALKHVQTAHDIFNLTWRARRREYVENFKELTVYKRRETITVDGNLDDPDWQDADVLSNFSIAKWRNPTNPPTATSARVVYDRDFLYVGVECQEPAMDRRFVGRDVPRDSENVSLLGDHVELFYNYPDMADACYHLCINSDGLIIDARQESISVRDLTFKTRAKFAVRHFADKWTLEIAIPCSEIGQSCLDGATWKLNVARVRDVKGEPKEYSSVCGGAFQGVGLFVNMKFTPERAKGRRQGADVSAWRNGSFEFLTKCPSEGTWHHWRKWTFKPEDKGQVPDGWHGRLAAGERMTDGDTPVGRSYLRLRYAPQSEVSQWYVEESAKRLRVTFRARGTGKVKVTTMSYVDKPPGSIGYKALPETRRSKSFEVTPNWSFYSYETDKCCEKSERVRVAFSPLPNSTVDIDDCTVTPIGVETDMFPFVIKANGKSPAMDMSFLLSAPAGKDGFISVEGEHFVNNGGCIRFNGVNLVGAACFPDHRSAERLAERLSRLGINIVRIHYIDTWAYGSNFMKAPMAALFKNDPTSNCIVDEVQRERFEYLVAQLRRRGIYINMNLHVAHELDERDGIPKTPWANRGADFFYGPIIEREKAYARDILGHVNPYTGLALKDDPCVAMVEINNENGMFATWPSGLLDGGETFGREYQDEFRRQWHEFSGSSKDYLRAKAAGPSYTMAETNVFFRFLAHVDEMYFRTMEKCLKDDIGVKVPVCATQLGYSTPHTLAKFDIVDIHIYWTHPKWDDVSKEINLRQGPHRGVPWVFRNEAIVSDRSFAEPANVNAVNYRATLRVKGRPFMVSETSSPYPNWYGAEFNPFIRALAAFQDWAAVITHSWNNDLDPEPDYTTYFFSYAGRTDCLAHFPAMAAIFLRGDVKPSAERIDVSESKSDYFKRLGENGLANAGVHANPAGISGGRVSSSEVLLRGIGVDLFGRNAPYAPLSHAKREEMRHGIFDNGQFRFDQSDPQHAFLAVRTQNAKLFTGFSSSRVFDLGDGVLVEPGITKLGWCTVSLVSMDGNGFAPGSRILLAATGLTHNGGAKFTCLDGTHWHSRDDDFGNAKTVTEGVNVTVTLPFPNACCRALDENGDRTVSVPVETKDGRSVLRLGPRFRTVWYEVLSEI
ncbi:MAG: DUF4838 domain-containing protein [Kiritimatiellae bacterium]|nr:DUF4838 domain-containing protein [Kiritimatiellia bacterium]